MTEIIQMDETTWRLEDEYVRFFLLVGNEKAALIDSGINSANAKAVAKTLTDLPIILINTHGDRDHVSGTDAFSEIYMAPEDYQNCGLHETFPNTALKELHDNDVIDLGGRTLKVITVPGHTKGSIALLDVERRILLPGDSVQDGFIFMFGGHRDPSAYECSLRKLISMSGEFDKICPSHATPVLDSDYVEKVLVSWQEVQSGSVSAQPMNLHGMQVKAYQASHCGFYCD